MEKRHKNGAHWTGTGKIKPASLICEWWIATVARQQDVLWRFRKYRWRWFMSMINPSEVHVLNCSTKPYKVNFTACVGMRAFNTDYTFKHLTKIWISLHIISCLFLYCAVQHIFQDAKLHCFQLVKLIRNISQNGVMMQFCTDMFGVFVILLPYLFSFHCPISNTQIKTYSLKWCLPFIQLIPK